MRYPHLACLMRETYVYVCEEEMSRENPGGLRIRKGWGCSSEILNETPKRDRSRRGPSFFLPLKETMLKHRQYTYFYIFSLATLNETFTAKYDGVLPRTP